MATTKIDLLRDILTDALINLDFDFDVTDDGDGDVESIELVRDGVIDDMLSMIEDYDQNATNLDFTVRVVMDKAIKKIDTATEYGEVTPSDNMKKSEVL
jgi:hypothetical protein